MIIKSVTEMAVKYKDDCCCRIFLRLEKKTNVMDSLTETLQLRSIWTKKYRITD